MQNTASRRAMPGRPAWRLAGLLGLAVLGLSAGSARADFCPATNYAAGELPNSVAVGDFNGDGKLDLATANLFSGTVSVLLNNGSGTFASPTTYPAGTDFAAVAAGDFNGDNKLDLAVANGYGVSVLLNNGSGTFASPTNYTTGDGPVSVAVGDFNGDNKLDLAVVNSGLFPTGGNVSVLLNNGNGTFASPTNYTAGYVPQFVAVGDLNGDGTLDLAVANYLDVFPIVFPTIGSVSVLLNNGSGTFASAITYPVGFNVTSVAIGDFNGDGKLDLALTNQGTDPSSTDPNEYDVVSVLLNNGSGTFASPTNYTVGIYPISVAVGDFNGDGKLDLAVSGSNETTGTGNVRVLLNNGNGTFAGPINYPVGDGPASVAVGDFNGDHKLDLVTANQNSNNVSVLLNGCGDDTKPTCARTGTRTDRLGRKFVKITVQDSGSGLASIQVTKQVNATVSIPPFTAGTTDPVVVRATKIDQALVSQVELRITDVAGNVTICDLVLGHPAAHHPRRHRENHGGGR